MEKWEELLKEVGLLKLKKMLKMEIVKDAKEWADSLNISKEGDTYKVEIVNPVHYASYVEYGHRQEPGRYVAAIGKN